MHMNLFKETADVSGVVQEPRIQEGRSRCPERSHGIESLQCAIPLMLPVRASLTGFCGKQAKVASKQRPNRSLEPFWNLRIAQREQRAESFIDIATSHEPGSR